MIEFQYFSGCPHSRPTLDNIRYLVRSGFILTQLPVRRASSAL
ncbi:MAG: hypothetical protein OP8BY_2190 [Candidatus Saccharicenans subterraneus]|uniref:Uncharacterized protein n=1 Tax=Candidatus Saccharicenans subterraneus TaxID=2508984 RepID=A0A3E2BMD1_9BACT|nr:MAG: hypothetical protein OP8BY_2190 [Candidatus Saccharicenans subterraneum]